MKKTVFISFTVLFLILSFVGCKNDTNNHFATNNSITNNYKIQGSENIENSTSENITTQNIDEELIEKISNQLSSKLDISYNALHHMASCLCSVNATSIIAVSEIDTYDNIWKIKIVDEYTGDYLLVLDNHGYVNLIYKDSFEGEPIYYEYDIIN